MAFFEDSNSFNKLKLVEETKEVFDFLNTQVQIFLGLAFRPFWVSEAEMPHSPVD